MNVSVERSQLRTVSDKSVAESSANLCDKYDESDAIEITIINKIVVGRIIEVIHHLEQ